jgi:large subunit ribosomal protein L6
VEITIDENNHVTAKGPKGTLERTLAPSMKITLDAGVLNVTRPDDGKESRSLHGLTRTLLNNMVEGVTNGYKKELSVQGVGYKVAKEGTKLVMNIGYSHQVVVEETEEIKIEAPNVNTIIISGIDKQKVGQFAADVRKRRPPEPYKGKGIRYANEVVRHKEGKTGAKK